jgi:hypothetical protein
MIKPPQGRFPDAKFARAFSHQHPDKPVRQKRLGFVGRDPCFRPIEGMTLSTAVENACPINEQ